MKPFSRGKKHNKKKKTDKKLNKNKGKSALRFELHSV